MNLVKQIQIFGDSIMRGTLLNPITKRYCTNTEPLKRFEACFALQIRNQSRFGNTITRGCKQLRESLDRGGPCDMILLEYGGNDCDFNWQEVAAAPEAEHLPHTPLDLFQRTYREMLGLLKQRRIQPVGMSLPPIHAQRYIDWISRAGLSKENILRWLGDVQMIYRFQELYSAAVSRLAWETQTLFVDVRSAFLSRHNFEELLCEDGIHPNQEGHALIAEVFGDFASDYFGGRLAIPAL